MKLKAILTFTFILFYFLISASDVFAGPVIIRDNRVTDIGSTPVLGRGYTMSTNTFQSICLKDVKLTEPSYDFTYRFNELKNDSQSDLSTSTDKPELYDPIINKEFKSYIEKISSKKGQTNIREGKTYTKHRMVATIDLDSYYASVDEATTQLSDSAKNLLTNNDLLGYFDSCGSYYVRSLNRRAKLISVFEYEKIGTERDEEFEGMIETQIKSFKEVTVKKERNGETKSTSWYEKESEQVEQVKLKEKFNQKATEMNLSITTAGFGLGKDKEASLVSYDIDSFKQAIKDAFMAMQNPLTGKVISIEVVPWVENTEFQNNVKLNALVTIPETTDSSGKIIPEKTLQPFQMKHNINENAEFFAEIKKNDRNLLNIYYKAKMCKVYFDSNLRGVNGRLKTQYSSGFLLNHRTKGVASIVDLESRLNEAYIESLYAKEQEFMYTGQNAASKCMNSLISNDIRTVHYRNLNECMDVVKNMSNLQAEIIDDYCMPELTPGPAK